MWYNNIAGRFFGSTRVTDGQTDGQTDTQNYDSQDRASIAVSRGKNGSDHCLTCLSVCPVLSVTLAHCGQTVGWIKVPLCTDVGLGPGHIALVRDPAASTEKE